MSGVSKLLKDYESFEEAYDYIAYYLYEAYNKGRKHSALEYNLPVEFKMSSRKEDLKCP